VGTRLALIFSALAALLAASAAPSASVQANPRSAELAELCRRVNALPKQTAPAMTWIEGAEFTMGSTLFADAEPLHRVAVNGFWIDTTEVTNAEFARFVCETGYETLAERIPKPEDYPTIPREQLFAGSAVFREPVASQSAQQTLSWWQFVAGAHWRAPEGPGSSILKRLDHPVVHVAYADAVAMARWSGKRLLTEAEWELAARGGLDSQQYTWGNEAQPGGRLMANTFQGVFPARNAARDGYVGTAPVRAFPPNAFGLYGMAGNAWEWVSDWYRPDYYLTLTGGGSNIKRVTRNPRGPANGVDPDEPGVAKRVQKGGSFLCTDDYCGRYRPGARGKGEPGSTSSNVGLRLARDAR